MAHSSRSKPRRMKRMIAVLLCSVCVLGIIMQIEWASRMVKAPVVWAGYEGIYFSADGGKTKVLTALKAKNGSPINRPVISIAHGILCYWSTQDKMICVNRQNHPPVWLPIKITVNEDVSNIQPTPSGFLINLMNDKWEPSRVLLLNVTNRSLTPIPGIMDARSTAASPIFIGMTASRQLVTVPSEDVKFPNIALPNKSKWDADAAERRCCFTDGNRVVVLHNGQKSTWNVWLLYYIRDVVIRSEKGQIWISVGLPFSRGSRILVYDYEGHYLGKVLNDVYPIRAPMLSISHAEVLSLTQ